MAEAAQVLVNFVTKLPPELRVPETPLAVPASSKRAGLSQIINHLLSLDPPRPFDFIINGELLRKALEAHLLQHGISAEQTLEVEYVPAVVPPKADKAAPHDDWVSTVDGTWGAEHVVSGSYDGKIRIWHTTGSSAECTGSWHAHAQGVNAVACAPTTSQAQRFLYSAGKDTAVLMWQVDADGNAQLLANFNGHTDAVECVAVNPSGNLIATGGWDGQLMTWQAGQQVADSAAEAAAAAPAVPTKRRKGKADNNTNNTAAAAAAAAAPEGGLQQQPASTLQGPGHTSCLSCVAWASEGVLYSGSWDHAVRRWDIATGINTDTYNGSKAICSLATPGHGSSIVAMGCSDKVMRLWDPRSKQGEALAVKNCPSHAGWVVGLTWCPHNNHQLASTSHDHTIKVWDVRTTIPLATLSHHTDKALCVTWVNNGPIISGGADCKLLCYTDTAQGM